MVRVKICGITSLAGAMAAVDAGASAVGFVFSVSPRQVSPEVVRQITDKLPPLVSRVGVFVNAERKRVEEIAEYCRLDVLQFHGHESPEYCLDWWQPVIKAFRVKDKSYLQRMSGYQVQGYLLDTFVAAIMGGSGISFNWELARDAGQFGPVLLAGGITPENVEQAIRVVKPYAVDVSSSVESDGRKDSEKIRKLVAAVRRSKDEFARP